MMTIREMFDKVKAHLLKQNAKAKLEFGPCKYRTPEGLRCAVGCLIDEAHYTPLMESASVFRDGINKPGSNAALMTALKNSGVPLTPKALNVLDALQSVHDQYDPKQWENELNRVEQRVKLYEKESE